jgi:hypothetical protein
VRTTPLRRTSVVLTRQQRARARILAQAAAHRHLLRQRRPQLRRRQQQQQQLPRQRLRIRQPRLLLLQLPLLRPQHRGLRRRHGRDQHRRTDPSEFRNSLVGEVSSFPYQLASTQCGGSVLLSGRMYLMPASHDLVLDMALYRRAGM